MSSHQLAIAKASFSASLLRPDPKPVSRDDIAQFHTLLTAVTTECSPRNIQTCKRWILTNIGQSTGRLTSLGKYLVALSASFTGATKSGSTYTKPEPSVKRRRLHLLYFINDLLSHAQVHSKDTSFATTIQPSLVALFTNAASFKGSPKHIHKVQELLNIWSKRQCYSEEYIETLRNVVSLAQQGEPPAISRAISESNDDINSGIKIAKNAPFVMPAMHGDQSLPWYDLPAGNLMPHITPNSTRPINPTLVKPLQLVSGPVDETLVVAVKNFLRDVDSIFSTQDCLGEPQIVTWDIDELGEQIYRDEMTGDVLSSECYYGWSKSFCEKMRKRYREVDGMKSTREINTNRLSRSRSQSLSPAPTSSRSSTRSPRPIKRRRYSSSKEGSSRSRSRGMVRMGSESMNSRKSKSRSRSSERYDSYSASKCGPDESRGRGSNSNNTSRSPKWHTSRSRPERGGFDDSRYPVSTQKKFDPRNQSIAQDADQNSDPRRHQMPAPPPPPYGFMAGDNFGGRMPYNAQATPPPPPPPSHYTGLWPPPPPPQYGQHGQNYSGWQPPAPLLPSGPPYPQLQPQWQSPQYGSYGHYPPGSQSMAPQPPGIADASLARGSNAYAPGKQSSPQYGQGEGNSDGRYSQR